MHVVCHGALFFNRLEVYMREVGRYIPEDIYGNTREGGIYFSPGMKFPLSTFLSCSDVSFPGGDSCRVLDWLKSPNNDPCSLKDKTVRQKGEAEILKVGWFPRAIMEDQH